MAVSPAASGERVLDAALVEGLIRATTGLEVPITAADCPGDIAVNKGGSFECRVRYDNCSEELFSSRSATEWSA